MATNTTKADIIHRIAEATGITRFDTDAVINAFIAVIHEELQQGREIEIRGFGSFRIARRPARMARNPKTGAAVDLPERRVPQFRPSKELKKSVNEIRS